MQRRRRRAREPAVPGDTLTPVAASPFERAEALVLALGASELPGGRSLSEELRLGSDVSLWDAVAPLLLLYRFPHALAPARGRGRWILPQRAWAYRGWVASRAESVRGVSRVEDGCVRWPPGRTALFLAFSEMFLRDVLDPVARQLAERGRMSVAAIGTGRSVPHQVWAHWTPEVKARARELATALRRVRRLVLDTDLAGAIRRAGFDVAPAVLTAEMDRLFWRELPMLVPQLAIAEHVLDRHRPAVIVSPDNADQRCRVYLLLGRRRRLPVLLVQQGLVGKGYPDWRFLEADRVAVMGQTSLELIAEQGVGRERMVLTGHPGFDALAARTPAETERVRASLGVPAGRPLVVFASQPYLPGAFPSPAVRQVLLKTVADAARALPGMAIVVKPHPSENAKEIARVFAGTGAIVAGRATDITPLIRAADVFVTFFSTSALQALVAGTPVINVVWPGGEAANMYAASGATWVAPSADDLRRLIESLSGAGRAALLREREDAASAFVRSWAFAADGAAASRVADAAEALAGATV